MICALHCAFQCVHHTPLQVSAEKKGIELHQCGNAVAHSSVTTSCLACSCLMNCKDDFGSSVIPFLSISMSISLSNLSKLIHPTTNLQAWVMLQNGESKTSRLSGICTDLRKAFYYSCYLTALICKQTPEQKFSSHP